MCSVSSSSPAPSEPRAIATALASVRIGRQAVNSMTGRTRYGRASRTSSASRSANRPVSGSSQMTFRYRAPSTAAVSSTRSHPARSEPGRSGIASTSSTNSPVPPQRRMVSASMGEPGDTGHASSPGVTGATRSPTASNPASAATVTNSGGATSSIVRCSSPVIRATAALRAAAASRLPWYVLTC